MGGGERETLKYNYREGVQGYLCTSPVFSQMSNGNRMKLKCYNLTQRLVLMGSHTHERFEISFILELMQSNLFWRHNKLLMPQVDNTLVL